MTGITICREDISEDFTSGGIHQLRHEMFGGLQTLIEAIAVPVKRDTFRMCVVQFEFTSVLVDGNTQNT
jgi:hypothetical protein